MPPESGMQGNTLTPKHTAKNHSLGRLVAVNLGLLFLLLLLLEISLRIIHYPFNPQWVPSENAIAQFDKELGWSYMPNLSRNINFGATERIVYTDENGIRVSPPGCRLSHAAPSVLFIGDSYTMGHGLSHEESFVGQFASLADKKLQAVNLGVQAYGTDQAYLALKRFAQQFNTKVVVYTFIGEHIERNGNYDRQMLIPYARFLGTKPLFQLKDNGELYLANSPLEYRDYIHSWLYDALVMSVGPVLGTFPPYPEKLTHALIREMQRYCKEYGIRFILLNWRWNDSGYHSFDQLGVETIDALQQAPPGWEKMQIPGDDHPDAAAGAHIAKVLYDRINK